MMFSDAQLAEIEAASTKIYSDAVECLRTDGRLARTDLPCLQEFARLTAFRNACWRMLQTGEAQPYGEDGKPSPHQTFLEKTASHWNTVARSTGMTAKSRAATARVSGGGKAAFLPEGPDPFEKLLGE